MAGRAAGAVWSLGVAASVVLAGCGGATQTGGGTGAAGAGGSGNFVFAKLAPNEQIFSTAGVASSGPMFDEAGNALDGADPGVPNGGKAGTVDFTDSGVSVPFQFLGTTGETSEMVPNGGQVDITVPAGSYKTMYFLESTGNGTDSGAAIDLSLNYTDGSSDATTITTTDWTLTTSIASGSNEVVAFTTSDQIGTSGASAAGTFGVYVDPVPVNSAKQLKDVSVSAETSDDVDVQFNILALTLAKA